MPRFSGHRSPALVYRLLLFALGPLLAPFLTTAVSVPLYLVLDWKGKLEPAKRRLNRLKSPRAIAILCAVIALLFLVGFARYIDFPYMDKGVPGTLQFTTDEMDLKLGSPRYYCLGGFIDSEWLWQVHLSQEDFDALATKLYMDPVAPDIIRGPFLSKPPYWWRPAISDQIRAYTTSHFPIDGRGPDGWHAMATWNPETGVLHMWIKDNF